MTLREEANLIIRESIKSVLPDEAVIQALNRKNFEEGRVYLVAVGKAAWQMAKAAKNILGNRLEKGVLVTKYGHVKGQLQGIDCYEGGHPVPDENCYKGTQEILNLVSDLKEKDIVLFLVSGGGSALFEKPLISGDEISYITKQLLGCGADIVEINTIRKRLSAVKGGKFAEFCKPAKVYSIVLSDILGDPLDMIASGPAYPDSSTCEQAWNIAKKYNLILSEEAQMLLSRETPKVLTNVETEVMGSVKNLCKAAKNVCEKLGYKTIILTDHLDCEAKEAGVFLADIAKSYQKSEESIAFVVGGETVVHLTGKGKGGRNQELALSAARGISQLKDTAIFSIGTDGTDGPTDAAGGYVDEKTAMMLEKKGISIYEVLQENNAYNALKEVNGLIITGATGTNVNDLSVLLVKRK